MTEHENDTAHGLYSVAVEALRHGNREKLRGAVEKLRVYVDRCEPCYRRPTWLGRLTYLDRKLANMPLPRQHALL